MYQNKRVILIAPAFNEGQRIGNVVEKAKGTSIDEICVVNDASTDNSALVAEDRGAIVLSHRERKGVGAAIRTGIKYALENNFDIIVICAGNDKDNPKEVDRLLRPVAEEGYEYVQGSRFLKGGKWGNLPFHRFILMRVYSFFLFFLLGQKLTDPTNGFRAYSARLLRDERINLDQSWLNHYELESYLQYKAVILGYRTKEVPVTKIYPTKKTTKIRPILDWWKIMKPMFLLKLGIKK